MTDDPPNQIWADLPFLFGSDADGALPLVERVVAWKRVEIVDTGGHAPPVVVPVE